MVTIYRALNHSPIVYLRSENVLTKHRDEHLCNFTLWSFPKNDMTRGSLGLLVWAAVTEGGADALPLPRLFGGPGVVGWLSPPCLLSEGRKKYLIYTERGSILPSLLKHSKMAEDWKGHGLTPSSIPSWTNDPGQGISLSKSEWSHL